jgi:hypothetical protein
MDLPGPPCRKDQRTSATLARRVTELRDKGFNVESVAKAHPVTGRRYTRYTYAVAS